MTVLVTGSHTADTGTIIMTSNNIILIYNNNNNNDHKIIRVNNKDISDRSSYSAHQKNNSNK